MKWVIYISLLSFFFHNTFSQDFDLIVTINNDSIACHIDTITNTHIHFEMKHSGTWIDTKMDRNVVKDYKLDFIDKKKYIFKPGTSHIKKLTSESKSIKNNQKNSMYFEFLGTGIYWSVNYERLFPIQNQIGINARGGFCTFDGELNYILGANLLIGSSIHFVEVGVDFVIDGDFDVHGPIRIGYRYQGTKGLLLKAGISYIDSWFFFNIQPGLSIGFTF